MNMEEVTMDEVMMDVDEQQIVPDPLPFARRLVILFYFFSNVFLITKTFSIVIWCGLMI
jgi:hypothetical protein